MSVLVCLLPISPDPLKILQSGQLVWTVLWAYRGLCWTVKWTTRFWSTIQLLHRVTFVSILGKSVDILCFHCDHRHPVVPSNGPSVGALYRRGTVYISLSNAGPPPPGATSFLLAGYPMANQTNDISDLPPTGLFPSSPVFWGF